MVDPATGAKVVTELLKKIPEWISNLLKAWFRFFWRLRVGGKFAATVVEIIVLVLVVSNLPLSRQSQHSVIQIGAILFAFVLIFGILFGRSSKS